MGKFMIGHLAGTYIELKIRLMCTHLDFRNKALCTTAAKMLHEVIVEPSVNTIFTNGVGAFMNGNPLDFSLIWSGEFLCGMLGAFGVERVIEKYATEDMRIACAASVIGSYLGGEAYRLGKHAFNIAFHESIAGEELVSTHNISTTFHEEN
jgi:hypothetical protein